jgi:hypothetical protein
MQNILFYILREWTETQVLSQLYNVQNEIKILYKAGLGLLISYDTKAIIYPTKTRPM